LEVGPVHLAALTGASSSEERVETRPDGSGAYEMTAQWERAGLSEKYDFDSKGERIGPEAVEVIFTHLSEADAFHLGRAYGVDLKSASRAKITFSGDDARRFHERMAELDPRASEDWPGPRTVELDLKSNCDLAHNRLRVASGPYP